MPLWSLMLGTAWLDVVFVPLFATGIETIEPVAGTTGGYANGIIHADYTHSLLGALILSATFGGVFALFWGRRAGWILTAMAFSHWVIDLFVHRADMPILPANFGNLPLLGFGLWRWPALVIALEALLVVGGAWLYWRAARTAVAAAGGGSTGRADLAAGMILVFGVIVLILDVSGLIG